MLRNLWRIIWLYVSRFRTIYLSVDLNTWDEASDEEYLRLPRSQRTTYRISFFNFFGYPICYSSIELVENEHS